MRNLATALLLSAAFGGAFASAQRPVVVRSPEKVQEPAKSKVGEPQVQRGVGGPDLDLPLPRRSARTRRESEGLDLPRTLEASRAATGPKVPTGPTERTATVAPEQDPARETISSASSARLVESLAARTRVDDEEGKRIRLELRARGAEARVALRVGLRTERKDALIAIAELLAGLGEDEDYAALVERADQGLTATVARQFADLLLRREPKDPAFLQRWLVHKNPNLRAEAELRLREIEGDPQIYRELLRHPHEDVRRRAFHLLAAQSDPELVTLAFAHLDDPSPPNVEAFLQVVVTQADEVQRAELAQRVRNFNHDRAWALATTALLRMEIERGQVVFELADAPGFVAGFSNPDLFVAASAAAGACALGLRAESPDGALWLRERVPHLLVRAVGGREGHRELPLLRPTVATLLTRLSGEAHGLDGDAWRAWWSRVGGSFEPRLAWFPLDATSLDDLQIVYVRDDGRRRHELRFALLPAELGPGDGASLELRLLAPADRDRLVAALRSSGLHLASFPASIEAPEGTAFRSVRLASRSSVKRCTFPAGREPEAFAALATVIEEEALRQAWQPFRDADRYPSWRLFHAAEAPWWAEEHTDAERRVRLRELLANAIDDLEEPLKVAAFWTLREALPAGESLEEPAFEALLASIPPGGAIEGLDRAVLELAVDRGPGDALERVKTFFALRPLRAEDRLVLGELLAERPAAAVRAALVDLRPPVLAGAAEAAHVLVEEPPPLVELVRLMSHASPQVRLGAIRSLGRLGAVEANGALLDRYRNGEYAERLEAGEALARIGTREGLSVLSSAIADEDPMIRRAIFQGLEESSALPSALVLATFAIGSNAYHPDALRARHAFLAKPQAQIRSVCESLSEEPSTRRSALLLLAESLDEGAFRPLVELLEEVPEDRGVQSALGWLTCRVFTPDRALDDVRRFVEQNPAGNPQLWFYREATAAGFQLREGPALLLRSPSRSTLLALCDVLERGTPEMRMHAARYLSRALGEDLGYITTASDAATCAEIAEYCRALLEDRG